MLLSHRSSHTSQQGSALNTQPLFRRPISYEAAQDTEGPTDAVVRTRPGSRGRSALACERRAQWVTQGPLGVHPFPLARACIETQGRSRRRCFAGRQRRGAPSPRVRMRAPAHLRSIVKESRVRGAQCSWECRIPRSPPCTYTHACACTTLKNAITTPHPTHRPRSKELSWLGRIPQSRPPHTPPGPLFY